MMLNQINDPFWSEMWYVNRRDSLTMNVQGDIHIQLLFPNHIITIFFISKIQTI